MRSSSRRLPVGRDLQHGRPAQAAMGEEKLLRERRASPSHLRRARRGNAAQRAAKIELRAAEGERHQTRADRQHVQPELPRDPVGEIGRAQLRQRQPARRDHQPWRRDRPARRLHDEPLRLSRRTAVTSARGADLHAARRRIRAAASPRSRARTAVAEKLAQLFLVPGDAVPLHQRDEIVRRVAGQRRLAEVRIRTRDNSPAPRAGW